MYILISVQIVYFIWMPLWFSCDSWMISWRLKYSWYSVETSNGIAMQEQRQVINAVSENKAIAVRGD